MKLVFEDAELTDVALGRAIRSVPADDEAPSETVRRVIYNECNFQIYSLMYRSFTPEYSGSVDASGIKEYDGRALWRHFVKYNYELSDDNIPHLKKQFYDQLSIRQKQDMSLVLWVLPVVC